MLLILTAPPAGGKNTIAANIAKLRKYCAVIDVDLVRQMVLHPHKAPWEGEKGQKQQLLGVEMLFYLQKVLFRQNMMLSF